MCLVKRRQLIAPKTARSLKSGRSGRGLRQRHSTFWSIGFLIHEVAVTIPTSQCCLDNYACESHMGRYFVNYENHYCHNHANIWIGACGNSLYISLWNVPVWRSGLGRCGRESLRSGSHWPDLILPFPEMWQKLENRMLELGGNEYIPDENTPCPCYR